MLTFFFSPGSCSIGIRVLLEEAKAQFASTEINVGRGAQLGEGYRAINPKGKVPALIRGDGSLLTEFQTLAWWIARTYPSVGLLPYDEEGRLRVMESLDFMVGTVHMRGFTLIIVPQRFVNDTRAQAELRDHGRIVATNGLKQISATLGGKDWLVGRFSIADAALFYLTLWARKHDVPLDPSLVAFHRRMKGRPAVARALAGEGLDPSA